MLTFFGKYDIIFIQIRKGENNMQTKSPKTIQMILLTLLIVIVGEIIVGALSNNNSIAYSEEEVCSVCHMPTLSRCN